MVEPEDDLLPISCPFVSSITQILMCSVREAPPLSAISRPSWANRSTFAPRHLPSRILTPWLVFVLSRMTPSPSLLYGSSRFIYQVLIFCHLPFTFFLYHHQASTFHHSSTFFHQPFAIHPPPVKAGCLTAEETPKTKKVTQMKKSEMREKTKKTEQIRNIRRRKKLTRAT